MGTLRNAPATQQTARTSLMPFHAGWILIANNIARRMKNYQYSTERQKCHQKFSTSTGYREDPVRFGYGLGMERFERFQFSVPAVPLLKGFSVFRHSLTGKDCSGSGFGSWKTVPAVPLSLSGKP